MRSADTAQARSPESAPHAVLRDLTTLAVVIAGPFTVFTLAAVLALAQAHTEYHADIVQTLAKKWGTK